MDTEKNDQDGTRDVVTQLCPHAAQHQQCRTNPAPRYSELTGAIVCLLQRGQLQPLPELSLQARRGCRRGRNRWTVRSAAEDCARI